MKLRIDARRQRFKGLLIPLRPGPEQIRQIMVSFQEMTDTQVRSYAAMAAAAGCPLLYSMNRERSLYNTELVSVSEALADCYTLTEVPVLDTDYTSAFKKPPKSPRVVDPSEPRYRHLVGRLDPSARQTARDSSAAPSTRASHATGPRVVLGMTLYNAAQHLPHALESLLAQTHVPSVQQALYLPHSHR